MTSSQIAATLVQPTVNDCSQDYVDRSIVLRQAVTRALDAMAAAGMPDYQVERLLRDILEAA